MELLNNFLNILPKGVSAAFEFRNSSWFDDEVYSSLKDKDFALCLSETDEKPGIEIINTSNKGYLRLRKTDYKKPEIKKWHEKINKQKWEEAFIFLNMKTERRGLSLPNN